MNRRRHRLDALVRQVTGLGEEEAALLADPAVSRDIFEEITRMQSTDTPPAPPRRAAGRLRLAVAAAVAVLVAVAGFTAARLATSGQQPPSVAQPTGSEQTGPTGDLFGDAGFSCVEQYSPQTLAGRGFAFAGIVASIAESSSPPEVADPYVSVSFTVHQWFRGGQDTTVTVAMFSPDTVSSAGNTTYAVGSRLLVSGERRGVEPRPDELVAWACGFTRWYDAATATEWENALR